MDLLILPNAICLFGKFLKISYQMKYKYFLLIASFFVSAFAFSQHSYHCKHGAVPMSKSTQSDTLDILHYSIHLDIVYLSKKKIEGYTELKVVPKYNNVSILRLDLLKMSIDSVLYDGSAVTYSYNDTLLQIHLAQAMNLNDTGLVKVYYQGYPVKDPSGWGGFYFSSDSTFAFNLGVGMQDNPHNYGRVWYPCLDDFVDRATYDFHIRVKSQNTAVCNGTLQATTTHADGTKTYEWDLQNTIPTYLSSVAIGPYVAYEDTFLSVSGQHIPIAIYARASDMSNVQASFLHLKDILAAFEHYYGPYKWERVGYVGVPFSSGAMEHATNIALGLGYMNGTLSNESLIAHELSHHWFGDLVTCKSAEDMWLNEGWAVFSESLYQEMLYGRKAYRDHMRELHSFVIRSAHKNDNGYRAVAGIPHEYTYGSTVYDKGGTVAHSLRGYLGDSLFFPMLHAYMNQFSYADADSYDFQNFITNHTGVDVSDFFSAWVFEPGFVHYQIDSFSVQPMSSPNYSVDVYIEQKLLAKPSLANSNRVKVRFIDSQWNEHDEIVAFSGATGHTHFVLPISPIAVFVDPDEEYTDARIDYTEVISTSGEYSFPLSLISMNVTTLHDSAKLQISHHWVGPDTNHALPKGVVISNNRYWSVSGLLPINMQISGKFQYNKSLFDQSVITSLHDSVVILYRSHPRANWQSVPFSKVGSWVAGQLVVSNLVPGDYVLAKWDDLYAPIRNVTAESTVLTIIPNPVKDVARIEFNEGNAKLLQLIDVNGRIVYSTQIGELDNHTHITMDGLSNGVYVVELRSLDNALLSSKKLIMKR